jgi:hypothetical protein
MGQMVGVYDDSLTSLPLKLANQDINQGATKNRKEGLWSFFKIIAFITAMMPASKMRVNRLLPKSLFAWSKTFFDKSKACFRRFQNSPFGLKQLESLIFRFAKIY